MGSSKAVGVTAMILVVMMMMILNTSATTDKKKTLCSLRGGSLATKVANVDWLLTSTAYTVIVDLPGVEKLEIEVKKDDFEIMCQGLRTRPTENKSDIYFRGRFYGWLWRRFCFPEDAMMGHVHAKFDNGVLSLTIPRNQSVSAYIPVPHMFDVTRGPSTHFGLSVMWSD